MSDYYDTLTPTTVDLELTRPAWHRRAACRGMGTGRFFLDKGQSVGPALDVCRTCQVVAECREAGLGTPHGVWGATTPQARQSLRAERRAA